MAMEPRVSVIVPFYNAAATIERTLRSLSAQAPAEAEFVFVNDGSTDSSASILRSFVDVDSYLSTRCVTVESEIRRGAATAARLGLRASTGRYVMRCDADDFLEPGAIARMLDATDGERADVVIAPYIENRDGKRRIVDFACRPQSLNDMPVDTLSFSVCNKLIRRSLLLNNGIEAFDGYDCWEDLGVVSRVMSLGPRVAFVDEPMYNYMISSGSGSLTQSAAERIIADRLAVASLVEQWMEKRGVAPAYGEFLDHLKFAAKVKMLRGKRKDVDRWLSTFPEINGRIMKLRHVPLAYRLLFAAVAKLPAPLTKAVAGMFAGR